MTAHETERRRGPGLWLRLLTYRAMALLLRWRGRDRRSGAPLDGAASILVIRLDEIGDCVMTVPFLTGLQADMGDAVITVVMPPPAAQLLECQGIVDRVIPFVRPGDRVPAPIRVARIARFGWSRLRPLEPDVVVLPRWEVEHPDTLILAATSGAPVRVSYSERATVDRQAYGRGSDRLMTHVYDDPQARHEVERGLRLLELMGGRRASSDLALRPCPLAHQKIEALLAKSSDLPLVAFGIGARDPKRRWPASLFAGVANDLYSRQRFRAVLVGGAEDRAAAREFELVFRGSTVNLAGNASLPESHAAIACCNLFIGNDSGPMHLAASAGVSVVAVSGLPAQSDPGHANAPERFGPWGVRSIIVRPEPDLKCSGELHIDRVQVSDVARAANALLDIR